MLEYERNTGMLGCHTRAQRSEVGGRWGENLRRSEEQKIRKSEDEKIRRAEVEKLRR